VRDEIQLERVE